MASRPPHPADMSSLCTVTLYDGHTGEALASYRVLLGTYARHGDQPYRMTAVRPESRFAPDHRFPAIVVPIANDRAIDGVRVPVELRIEVAWPNYERRLVALEVSEGDSKRIELRLANDADPGQGQEAFEAWSRRGLGDGEEQLTVEPTRHGAALWTAFQTVLTARPYATRNEISRVRRASALLFQAEGLPADVAEAFRDAHARTNAFLDARELEIAQVVDTEDR